MARASLFSLKEVGLDVLLEARTRDEVLLQLDDIRKRLGIPRVDALNTERKQLLLASFPFSTRRTRSASHKSSVGITEHAAPLLEIIREGN